LKLPVLHKVEIEKFELGAVLTALKKEYAGEVPCVITLELEDIGEIKDALEIIVIALSTLNIHPRFPYPLYIITDKIQHHPDLCLIKKAEDIPEHFVKRLKKIKGREQALLNKTQTILERIQNHPVSEEHEYIKHYFHGRRELKDLSHQVYFFERILKKLQETSES
jgi:hypothetical protein